MDPESKKLLEKTFELVKENNDILCKIRSTQKWQTFWSIARVIIIVFIALGAVYFLEPYIEKIIMIFNQISGTQQVIDMSSLQNILKNIKP